MPNADKENSDKQKDSAEQEVQRDALGNAIEPGVPPLTADKEESTEAGDTAKDAKEPKDVPPDLIPISKTDDDDSDSTSDDESKQVDGEEPQEQSQPGAAKDEDEDTPFDDEKTDQAINDIVAKEGDDILAVQDAAAAKGVVKASSKRGGFWRSKWVRFIIALLLLGGIAAALVVPASRYWALNTAGVRSSSSVEVVDSTTQLPLKGVDVSLGDRQVRTDSEGKASFADLKLGATQLTIDQVGFEKIQQNVVIGWGSNPLGRFALRATGVQYVIEVKDYVSGQPVEGVEATNGGTTAVSDKDGKITLTLENTAVAKGGVALSKSGYRSESIGLGEDPAKPTKAALVMARKAVFVSRQNGKYDVFKSDVDGGNREVLLAATGNENSNIALVTNQDGTRAAYVSTRDNKRDAGGFLLSSLVLINVETGNTTTIAEAAQIQLIDWIGSRLVFQLGSSSTAAEDRYTIVSYDYNNNTRVQLAAAKKLQAVLSAKGSIYYAPAADTANPSLELGLFKVAPDGKGKQRVFDAELSSVLRQGYGTLSLQAADGTWYSYDLTNNAKTQTGTPGSLASRLYVDNDVRSKSLWAGQGTLRLYDVGTAKDTDVAAVNGLTYPLQWAGASAVIFRVSNATETADYVASFGGGTPRKIADVTPTYGFSQTQ